jgi:tight adherence protein C
MEYAFIVIAAAAAACVAFLLVSSVLQRAELRTALRQLDGYEVVGARHQEMLSPLGRRVVAPVLNALLSLGHRSTPQGYLDKTREKLVLAGNPERLDVDQILIFKVLAAASGIAWIALVFGVLGMSGGMAVLFVGALWIASFLAPDLVISNKTKARQHEIAVQLPDVLDLLVISVEAGLGFDQAVERTASAVPGALSEEFRRMLQETRIGATRADALRAMEERTQVPELRSFILAMLQADTFGVSIARVLRTQSDAMRARRRLRAQEKAQKAPVKMLFPLVFCIFPAVFVVVAGPAAINLMRNL